MLKEKAPTKQGFLLPVAAIVVLFSCLLLTACGSDPEDELRKKINIDIRNDNKVDETEWNELTGHLLKNRDALPGFVENDTVNTQKLVDLILEIARHRRGQPEPAIDFPQKVITNAEKPKVGVFIENSGSMDGYVRGSTEFEAALSDLLVQIEYHYEKENLKINFINTKVYPSQITEVNDFVEKLEPEKAPYKVGDRKVSKLNEILKMILDSTSPKKISILVSDCIYSLDPDKDTEGALEFEKSLTKGAFLNKSKEFDFATFILKMKSKFTGNYYAKDNSAIPLNGVERPYYIWIVGPTQYINELSRDIKTKSLKGFQESYFLSNLAKRDQPTYTVLKETNKIGSFRQADRNERAAITSINEIDYSNGIFQFSLAIDLSQVPVDSNYLKDPANYYADGFKIVSIEKKNQDKLRPNEWKRLEKIPSTHIITVSTTTRSILRDLNLELLNNVPGWVEYSNSTDDRNVRQELDKTFGLAYLIKGVSEAYATLNPAQRSWFKIKVSIKK